MASLSFEGGSREDSSALSSIHITEWSLPIGRVDGEHSMIDPEKIDLDSRPEQLWKSERECLIGDGDEKAFVSKRHSLVLLGA